MVRQFVLENLVELKIFLVLLVLSSIGCNYVVNHVRLINIKFVIAEILNTIVLLLIIIILSIFIVAWMNIC